MLEKPDLQDQLILACLNDEYGLRANRLAFLPLGADVNTAVFRVVMENETAFFLKLRKGAFYEVTVTVPQYLHAQGIQVIIAPLETTSGQPWVRMDDYTMILYPFIEGRNGYKVALSDQQWLDFGAALKVIHATQLPPELARLIPRETYSAHWREMVTTFQVQIEEVRFHDPTAIKTAVFMKSRRDEITYMVVRADQLGHQLQGRTLDMILCHSDIHPGNLLLGVNDSLYIVDWDNPIFAPKERDLMLIGGCGTWNNAREENLFYQGYRQNELDHMALAYYRYERIIQDIAAYCEQLLLTELGGEDREQSFTYFSSQFLPHKEVEIAIKNDTLS